MQNPAQYAARNAARNTVQEVISACWLQELLLPAWSLSPTCQRVDQYVQEFWGCATMPLLLADAVRCQHVGASAAVMQDLPSRADKPEYLVTE